MASFVIPDDLDYKILVLMFTGCLTREEISYVAYLYGVLIHSYSPSNDRKSALDLFIRLESRGIISSKRLDGLLEIAKVLKRNDLAEKVKLFIMMKRQRNATRSKEGRKGKPRPKANVSVEDDDKKLFGQAMLRGYVESGLALLILMGVTGSGKSEFKRLVLGQEVPDFSHSTPLAESAVRSISICQAALTDLEWREIGPEKMLKMVAGTIKGGLPLLAENEIELPAFWDSSLSAATLGDATPSKKTDFSEHLLGDQLDHHQAEQKHQEGKKINSRKVMKTIKIDSNIHKLMSTTEGAGRDRLMGVEFIYMLDSGGQPPFREMLPHFVQHASAIVLMQKLNERLDYKPTIRYREEGGKVDKGYTSQITNEQILHQYVQGIQSHDSKVFVIGTHRDEEDKCDETREDKNKKLIEAFRPVLGEQMELYKVGNPDQLIFPVNCTSREPDDEAIAREFRKRMIEKCMGKKKEIPMPWFVLEQLLHLLAKRIKVSVLSIDECCDAAQRKLLMPRNACEAALRYLGKLNIIFFRPDVLPGIVFSNAQVILDKLTELVRCNHALRTEGGNSDAVPSHFHNVKGMKFREYGLLDAELLDEAFPSHYREDIFTAPDLLLLLEKMLIAGRLNSGEHFIPSLLPDLPVEKIAEYRVTAPHPPPLVIYYPEMWLPVGVMSSLVAYLQNEGHWIPAVENGEPICMYHNCVEFLLPKKKRGDLVLIDSTKFLEVHVRPECKLAKALLYKIKDDVLTGLEKAHESLHYDPPETEIGWLCSGDCGSEKIHLAELDDDKVSWTCPKNHKVGGELKPEQQLWFKINDPAAVAGANTTTTSLKTPKESVLSENLTPTKPSQIEHTMEGAELKKRHPIQESKQGEVPELVQMVPSNIIVEESGARKCFVDRVLDEETTASTSCQQSSLERKPLAAANTIHGPNRIPTSTNYRYYTGIGAVVLVILSLLIMVVYLKQQGDTSRGCLSEEPTIRDLLLIKYRDSKGEENTFRLIDKVQTKCLNLGIHLGIDDSTLEGLKQSHSHSSPTEMCKAIFQTWIDRGEGVTWAGLIQALDDTQLGGISRHLQEALA